MIALESLLNAGDKHIEVGAIPPSLASALPIPPINSGVAFVCLQQLASHDSDPRQRTAEDLEVIDFLLGIMASGIGAKGVS